MTQWYRLDLGNGADAYAPTRKIQEAFMATVMLNASDAQNALFSRYDIRADNVEIYFAPGAALVARAFHAIPCDKPSLTDDRIGSLGGGTGSELQFHFPDQPRG